MAEPLPPQIGKYLVQAALGEGGFGRVYRAFDPTVGRLVAIKVLTTQHSPDMLQRFQNEATAAGNLRHRNIVVIYEFGTFQDSPFIAMEYLEGTDLSHLMYGNAELTLLEKVRIMTHVGEGLQYAHDHGVIHRDVKPPNIMVLSDGSVKILDFGIARLTMGDEQQHLTRAGDLIGTIRYMSPEQFNLGTVTALSDIFAYGVVFYELLTDFHPFDSPNMDTLPPGTKSTENSETRTMRRASRKSDASTVMYRITKCAPPRLSEAVPGIPPLLERVVMTALEKDPDLRYQRLEDLLLELRPLQLELQKERAVELVARSRKLFDTGDINKAQSAIREAIELDSGNSEAWKLRERIHQTAHRKSMRPKVEALLKSAAEAINAQQHAEAVEMLESATRLDPQNEAAREQLKAARKQRENSREASRLLAEARREMDARNLPLAESLAAQAIAVDPLNQEAKSLAESIRRQQEQQAVRQVLENARRLAAMADYDAAIERLESIADAGEGAAEARTLLARVREQKAEHQRQERLRSEKQVLRLELKDGRLEEALPRLESLCREFPKDTDLAALLADTRQQLRAQKRTGEVRAAAEEVARLRTNNRFAEAAETLRKLDAAYPEDREILGMMREVERALQEYAREKVTAALRLANQLRGEKRFDDARAALEEIRREFPDHPDVVDAERRFAQEETVYRQSERTRKAMSSAQSELAAGRYDAAVSILGRAVAEDPQHIGLLQMWRDAAGMAETDRRTRAANQFCAEARKRAGEGDSEGAIEGLRAALSQHPGDPRLQEALDEIATQKMQAEAHLRLAETIQNCTRLLKEKRYPEAVFQLTMELRKLPGEPSLVQLRDKAGAEWEAAKRTEALDRALVDIRKSLDRGQYLDAELWLAHYRSEYGNEPAFQEVRTQVENALRGLERTRAMEAHLKAIQEAEERGDWESAVSACKAAGADFPGEPRIAEAARRVDQEVGRRRRGAECARREQSVRQAITEGDWNGAARRLDELTREYPDAPGAAEFRKRLDAERLRREAARAMEEATSAVERRDWAAADRWLGTAEAAAPGTLKAPELRQQVREGLRRDQSLTEARKALSGRQWDDVERLLGPFASRVPLDTEVLELLAETRQKRAAEEAQQAVSRGLKEAAKLTAMEKFDAALEVLRRLTDRYGANEAVEQAREATQAARERAAEFAELAGLAREAIRGREWAGATLGIEDLTNRFPAETAAAGLRGDLDAARRQAASEALAEAEAAIRRGEWAAAESSVAKSLTVGPQTGRHAELRRQIAYGQQRDEALASGRAALDAGRLDEVELLLGPFSGQPDAQAVLAEAARRRAEEQARRAIATGTEEARKRAAAGKFGEALAMLDSLEKRYPGHRDVSGLRGEVMEARDRAAAEAAKLAIAKGLEQACSRAAAERFEDALATLDGLTKRYGANDEVAALRGEVSEARDRAAAEAAKVAIAKRLEEIGSHTVAGNFTAAFGVLDGLTKQYGADADVARARAEVSEARDRAAAEAAKVAIAKGLEEIGSHTAAGNFAAAFGVLDGLTKQYGADADVARARAEVTAARDRAAQEAAQRAIANGLEAGAALAAEGKCAEALAVLEALAARFPTNTEVAAARVRAVEEAERQVIAQRLEEAGKESEAGRPAEAAAILGELAARFPANTEVAAARSRAAEEARKQALAKALEDAKKLAASRQYDAALQALERLWNENPADPDVEHALLDVTKARDFAAEAGAAIAGKDWTRAAQQVEELEALFGEAPASQNLRASLEAERQQEQERLEAEKRRKEEEARQALAKPLEEARNLAANGGYDAAVNLLERLLADYPANSYVERLLQETRAARDAVRKAAVDSALAEAEAAIANGDWFDAEICLTVAEEAWPGAPGCAEMKARIEAGQREEQERIEALRRQAEALQTLAKGLDEAKELAGKGGLDAAVSLLERLLADYPANPQVERLLEETRGARDEAARRAAVDAALAEADAAIANGDWFEAELALAAALEIAPDAPGCAEVKARIEAGQKRGRERTEARRRAESPAPAAPQRPASSPVSPNLPPPQPGAGDSDDNVQFTVYRPNAVPPNQWCIMLAFAHLAGKPPEAPAHEPEPVKEVERQAQVLLGQNAVNYQPLREDASQAVPRAGMITFMPHMEGVEFNPNSYSFLWQKSVHRAEFELRAAGHLNGTTARGRMTVFLGSIVIAEIGLSIRVDSSCTAATAEFEWVKETRFRKIFASYSHKDVTVVEEMEDHARAQGDQYIRDMVDLRVGQAWSDELRVLIDDADVFQLFWSSNSMHSDFVRQEWQYAISLPRREFVRPVYWEESLPTAPGLPPPELSRLHFHKIRVFSLGAAPAEARRTDVEAQRALGEALEEVRKLAAAGNFDAALAAVERISQSQPANPEVERARSEVVQARDRAREARKQAAEVEAEGTEQAIAARNWAEAERRLAAAQSAGADAARLAAARAAIERGRNRDEAVRKARAAIGKGRFEEAERALSPILLADSGDAEAAGLAAEARQKRAQAESAEAVNKGLKQAAAHVKKKQYGAAADLLNRLQAEYGSDPEVHRQIRLAISAIPQQAAAPEQTVRGHAAPPAPARAAVPIWRQPLWVGAATAVMVFAVVVGIRPGRHAEVAQQRPAAGGVPAVAPPAPEPVAPPPKSPVAADANPDTAGLAEGLMNRGEWEKARATINNVPAAERGSPGMLHASSRLRAHDDNRSLMNQARTEFQRGNFATAEGLAGRVTAPEFKKEADKLRVDVHAKRKELAGQVTQLIAQRNAAGARTALAAFRKAFPADSRLSDMEAKIKELEP